MSGPFGWPLHAYDGERFNAELVFNTNCVCCVKLRLLETLLPAAEEIGWVRRTARTIETRTQLALKNRYKRPAIFRNSAAGTEHSRAEVLANDDGMVGYARGALKKVCCSEESANLMLLRNRIAVNDSAYAVTDFATSIPSRCSTRYRQCQLQSLRNLCRHARAGCITCVARKPDSVLPQKVFRRFENNSAWRNPTFAPVMRGWFKAAGRKPGK